LLTVFESLFNTAAFVWTFAGAGAVDATGEFCLEPAVAAGNLAGFDSIFFVSFTALPATLLCVLPGLPDKVFDSDTLAGDLVGVTAFLTGVALSAFATFFTSGFTFSATCFSADLFTAFGAGLATTLAGATFATTFVDPFTGAFAATFGAGLAAAFTGAFDAGLATAFAALFAMVLLADLDELLVVVIFGADPNFRLAAFFSVAGDFVDFLFALGATAGFAGFFMLSPLNQNQGLIERAFCSLNCTTVCFALLYFLIINVENYISAYQ